MAPTEEAQPTIIDLLSSANTAARRVKNWKLKGSNQANLGGNS
jgi:hypothetical protein